MEFKPTYTGNDYWRHIRDNLVARAEAHAGLYEDAQTRRQYDIRAHPVEDKSNTKVRLNRELLAARAECNASREVA